MIFELNEDISFFFMVDINAHKILIVLDYQFI